MESKKSRYRYTIIELAGKVNASMPDYVINKTVIALKSIGKDINKSKILLLGLAYKKNVDDLRESPSLEILDKLIKLGGNVKYSDPYINSIPRMRKYNFSLSSSVINSKNLNNADLILLATDHDDFDYDFIEKEANLIVDSHNRFNNSEKVVKA